MGRDSERRARKRRRATFNCRDDWDRWTEDERIKLFFMEISAIKRILYRKPFKGKTTVYKPETVAAYWDELMNRMPEGREPEPKTGKNLPMFCQNINTQITRI